MPRFHCPVALVPGATLALPAGAARHVQVLRLQPGDAITLFDGRAGEHQATVERMGRSEVVVTVGEHNPVEREPERAVHLAVGMPANERMDWLVEKATELGVASIQPLMTAHGVLRLSGERADKKRTHWEAIAIAACEQCGRNRVPVVHAVQTYAKWLESLCESDQSSGVQRLVLSLSEGTRGLTGVDNTGPAVLVLSGPEGGLSNDEDAQARAAGFAAITLGPRVLRAETAALAALVQLASERARTA
ncbi:16S rRNA (uracil(1498)-N(3))-methyltransferase [Variovorax sp. J22R133]|uniref:16S rRNA (uracil(1498)-N(3))-methyltransferase n=1 Tax=Variovorax brevis TaxID=3053503 RepID=UPI00257842A4|nr:16S rRNA (uracil(1498)-N(3))-methyltransferase [Variovorax sp. J22R133]MDM0111763.1 16S rRNA (uracil(1498)-N(3))-methyltransferase [Variovorax sp. J22R133]